MHGESHSVLGYCGIGGTNIACPVGLMGREAQTSGLGRIPVPGR
ncbi:hypothetical protein [Streptosporangium canum]